MPYIPHTPDDTKEMLEAIGALKTFRIYLMKYQLLCNMQDFKISLLALTKWKC